MDAETHNLTISIETHPDLDEILSGVRSSTNQKNKVLFTVSCALVALTAFLLACATNTDLRAACKRFCLACAEIQSSPDNSPLLQSAQQTQIAQGPAASAPLPTPII